MNMKRACKTYSSIHFIVDSNRRPYSSCDGEFRMM